MSFPAYPEYKASGDEWLDAVPSHWGITRLKRVCDIFPSNVDKKSTDGQLAVHLCNYTDVYYNDLIEAHAPFMEATATDEQIEKFSLRAGDTIITKDSETPDDIARSAYVPQNLTGVVCGYHLSLVRPKQGAVGAFIKRYFDSSHARGYFHVRANGLTRVGLGQYSVDNAPIAIPPLDEQTAIASFLDRETAKIDALVEEQRRLIALLKEKRQAVISHAVTKGLDTNAPVRDSGIDWLGAVPVHWKVKPLKYLIALRSGGTPSKARPDFWDGSIPWASAKDLKSERLSDTIDHLTEVAVAEGGVDLNPIGSILILVRGMTLARAFPVAEILVPMAINQDLKAVLPRGDMSSQFLVWGFRGTAQESLDRCSEAGHGTKALRMNDWLSMPFPCPPKDEQRAIALFLDDNILSIDQLISVANSAIDLLQERRAALISAAVTGKIDVRSSAKVLPFPIERTRARGLVATEIIERSAHQPTFGRVKLQKVAFLAEAHVGIPEIDGSYLREAAGPLDRALVGEMERGAETLAGICADQPCGAGTMVTYRVGRQRGTQRQELLRWLGQDRSAKLDKLIDDIATIETKGAEAVATLYAVWNDALIAGSSPDDDTIVSSFLNDWHPEKQRKFRADALHHWLDWMRRHDLVPTGKGPKTSTGRLFV